MLERMDEETTQRMEQTMSRLQEKSNLAADLKLENDRLKVADF